MYVVAHVAVSVEGSTTGFEPDMRRFYELASTFKEDVTLVGADTILAQEEALASAPQPGPAPAGPLLAIVDGRGRVSEWESLRNAGHWSDVLALHTMTTPPRPPGRTVRELIVGRERVDLAEAIDVLGRNHGANVIRVDSGGALIGALLKEGLLDEVSLLVHPCLAGARGRHFWYGTEPASVADLQLTTSESFDGGLVWLRYRVHPAE
ncbi:dihydrofolate reductase family protein [Spirillospora sp. NPDC029432]|uniref:dihydrofolate reductase family protein n=1 Tax=Spirillospora sp. NPDC029432 TaxID=3154599 RepID=UPI003453A894